MDINLYCSFSESWGQVIIESLTLNTPCIYSNNAGISEMIKSTRYLINEYDNVVSIARKIEFLLNDKRIDFNLKNFKNRVGELNKLLIQI